MIIVIGSVTVSADGLADALRLSQEHVDRSRLEPGCISHDIYQDAEDPRRLAFVERWETMAALEQHFQVPESGLFITTIADLATVAPAINLYESSEIVRH